MSLSPGYVCVGGGISYLNFVNPVFDYRAPSDHKPQGCSLLEEKVAELWERRVSWCLLLNSSLEAWYSLPERLSFFVLWYHLFAWK